MRILVADDNDINLKVACAFLKALGVEKEQVLTAKNGEEAIDLCLAHQVDLVFMDIQMPVIDGVDATKAIISQVKNPPCIVALTANAHDDLASDYLNSGMKMVIAKPVTKASFRQALDLVKVETQ